MSINDERYRCPRCNTYMLRGRKIVTQDGKEYWQYICPKCGHIEKKDE